MIAFTNTVFDLGSEFNSRGFYRIGEINSLACTWDFWERHFPTDISNFVTEGSVENMDPQFVEELQRAVVRLVKRKSWPDASPLRSLHIGCFWL